jgi:hypothetical protein
MLAITYLGTICKTVAHSRVQKAADRYIGREETEPMV